MNEDSYFDVFEEGRTHITIEMSKKDADKILDHALNIIECEAGRALTDGIGDLDINALETLVPLIRSFMEALNRETQEWLARGGQQDE
jgi:hypothetical protein